MSTDLPNNWQTRRLGDVSKPGYGKALDKSLRREVGRFPVVGSAGVMAYTDKALVEGAVLVVGRKGNVGDVQLFFDGVWPIDTAYFLKTPDSVEADYLFHFLVAQEMKRLDSSTTTPSLRREDLEAVELRIPPPEEQREIVRILEEQFSRLDAAAASIAAVRRKADQFRRSLLNTAFAGGLSRGGARGMSPVLPSGWSFLPLGSCGAWFGGGTPSKSNKKFWTNGTIPWLSPKDMGPSVIVETQDKITDEAVKGSPTALVASNSVAVVVRSGILERRLPVALVPFVTTLNQDMKALEVRGDLLPKWVLYALQAFNNEVLSECRKAGTTVASIEFPRLRDFEIPVAPLDEQAEIVRILEEQFSHQTAILAIADEVEHRLSALRRSLLHAAFTGELTKEWREKNNG